MLFLNLLIKIKTHIILIKIKTHIIKYFKINFIINNKIIYKYNINFIINNNFIKTCLCVTLL